MKTHYCLLWSAVSVLRELYLAMCFFHQQANKPVGDGDFVNTWSCKDFQDTQDLFDRFMSMHCCIIWITHNFGTYISVHSISAFFGLLFPVSIVVFMVSVNNNRPTSNYTQATINQPTNHQPQPTIIN